MSSAQGKMRTNGMFLRSFDSKRYQELQAQKQKILEKQKELMKIKEKGDAKKKQKDTGKTSGTEDELEKAAESAEIKDIEGASSVVTKFVASADGTTEETVSEILDFTEPDIKCESDVEMKTENGENNPNENDEKSTKKQSKTSITVRPSETVIQNGASVENVKAVSKAKPADAANSGQGQRGLKKSLSGQSIKEYAIIAKQNQQAIKRESELVQKTDTGIYAKQDILVNKTEEMKRNQEMVKKLMGKQNKSNSDAYAVVDLTVTMNLVNAINENNVNGNTEQVTANGSVGKGSSKHRKGTGYTDYKDIINNYKHHNKMSRSAGYSGDIDTSTSSLEPDYDYAHVDQYLTSKLSLNKDRLVITEEQLNSLQTITSSSSG